MKKRVTAVFLVVVAAQALWLGGCSDGDDYSGGYNYPNGWGPYGGSYPAASYHSYTGGLSSGGYPGYSSPYYPVTGSGSNKRWFEDQVSDFFGRHGGSGPTWPTPNYDY